MKKNVEILYKGSVKDIGVIPKTGEAYFDFTDRYSLFDWGVMPDQIEGKGRCNAFVTGLLFKRLENPNNWKKWRPCEEAMALGDLNHLERIRMAGVKNHLVENDLMSYEQHSSRLKVRLVNVIRPVRNIDGGWCYDSYKVKPSNCLVPLEVIFRFCITKGSSILNGRGRDVNYCREIGLNRMVMDGDEYEIPLIEFSTKLEEKDRIVGYDEAREISAMSYDEFERIYWTTFWTALRLKDYFKQANIKLQDGKLEYAFGGYNQTLKGRELLLADSIGPDEFRLEIENEQHSKEILRTFYRDTEWFKNVEIAKDMAKKEGRIDWRDICASRLLSTPPTLTDEKLVEVSRAYKLVAEKLSQTLESC